MTKKERYRNDPVFRRKCLDSSKKSTTNASPLQKYRTYVSKRLYVLREAIEFHYEKISHFERELIWRAKELEKVKKGIKDGFSNLSDIQIRKRVPKKSPTFRTANGKPFNDRTLQIRGTKERTDVHD